MLAIGRALMAKPSLLLFDEPSMGLAPILVDQIIGCHQRAQDRGHNHLPGGAECLRGVVHRRPRHVLETGKVILEGSGRELLADEKVQAAYLGV
jgi:branched-chain amino acid transport system ATP-binding protein